MALTDFLYSIIIFLLGGLGYFAKRTYDDVGVLKIDVADMKPKVSIMWELLRERAFSLSSSPTVLNEKGKQLLYEGGVKEIVDANVGRLMRALADLGPQNAYQVQEGSHKAMRTILDDTVFVARLEKIAFKNGVNVDALLFVGAIYLRDLALSKCEM